MKLKNALKAALLLAGAVCLMNATKAQAQDYDYVTNKISVTGSYFESGTTNTAESGAGKATADKKGSITTGILLTDAWEAEGSGSPLPHTAVLALYYYGGAYGFEIETNGAEIYDLTGDGIMAITNNGPDLGSAGSFGTNGPGEQPFSSTDVTIWGIGFSTSDLTFGVSGVATLGNSMGAPNGKGVYKVSGSITFTGGVGAGIIGANATPILVSGLTITGSGSATVNPNASGGDGSIGPTK